MFNSMSRGLFKYLTLLQISRALFCLTVPGTRGRMSPLILERDFGLIYARVGSIFNVVHLDSNSVTKR